MHLGCTTVSLRAVPRAMLRRRSLSVLAASLALFPLASPRAWADGEDDARLSQKGIALALARQCGEAIPLLEQAERLRHRPAAAMALADCYVEEQKPSRAADLFEAISLDGPHASTSAMGRAARKKLDMLASRVAYLRFHPADTYPDLEIELEGRRLPNFVGESRVDPDVRRSLVVRAKGFHHFQGCADARRRASGDGFAPRAIRRNPCARARCTERQRRAAGLAPKARLASIDARSVGTHRRFAAPRFTAPRFTAPRFTAPHLTAPAVTPRGATTLQRRAHIAGRNEPSAGVAARAVDNRVNGTGRALR